MEHIHAIQQNIIYFCGLPKSEHALIWRFPKMVVPLKHICLVDFTL